MCDLPSCETSYYKMLTFLNKHVIFKLLKSYRTNHLKMTVGKLLANTAPAHPKVFIQSSALFFQLKPESKKMHIKKTLRLFHTQKDHQHTRQISHICENGYDHKSLSQLSFKQYSFRTEQTLALQNLSYHHAKMYHKPTNFFVLLPTQFYSTQCYLKYTVLITRITFTCISYSCAYTCTILPKSPENISLYLLIKKTIISSCTRIHFLLYVS